MLQPIVIMVVGLAWVSASLFFRREIDPIYAQIPLMASLVIFLLLLMHAVVLAGIGKSLGRPYQAAKKKRRPKGIPPPSISFVGTWSFIALATLGAGIVFRSSDAPLALALWGIGGVTLLSALCFLLIPAQVHSENADGEIVFKPNPVRMAPKAIYFWSSSIIYGGFFLVSGAILKPSATIGSIISMGTGAGWLSGALILSLVALFRMGLGDEGLSVSKTKLLVPGEDFSQIPGNPEIKAELSQILYQVATAQKSVGSVPNGILLTGTSQVGRTIFARALAGEYKRPLYNLSLEPLLSVDGSALDNYWKGFLFKIKPFAPLVIYLENYGRILSAAAQSNPQGLHNIQVFLSRLARNRTHLLIASADKSEDLPKTFYSPPIIHWIIPIPLPDIEMRKALLARFLLEESKKNEILPGHVPLLTSDMIAGFDLGKLAALMDGFAPEDIRDVVLHSSDYARKLRRSLRQLDIDVSIRRKAQNWKDPTAGPMEVVRSRLTDQTMGPFLVNRANELFSNRQKKSHESILIIGRNRPVRRMIAEKLSQQAGFSFLTITEEKKLDGTEFRNLLMKSRKNRPSTVFVDPLEELFPKVQLSNYGYHGEIYNQKVMELAQANEDKNVWLIAGAEDINRIDPFIARRFSSLLDLAELGRSLFSELEEFALGRILEGVPADKIDFSEYDAPEKTPKEEVREEGEKERKGTFLMAPPDPELLPGFPGRPDLQGEIRAILDSGTYQVKKGGSGVLGAFLFAGPRGTGKLEGAQAIAHHLDPGKGRLVVRDMGLYADRLFASMLLQRPLGSSKSSPLPEGIRTILEERPDAVLFLDNIERAHPSAWDFLPDYLKDGVINSGGKPLPVPRSTLILGTSLFSGDEMELVRQGNRAEMILEKLSEKNRRLAFLPVFSRETLNSLDLIVPFPGYTDADITDISRRTLYDTLSRF
ncbi:MAG: putative ATP-dependent Clp protease, partial [Leptospirillum sp. Group IV 'UBA BS']